MKAFGLTKVCNKCKYRELHPDVSCGSGIVRSFFHSQSGMFCANEAFRLDEILNPVGQALPDKTQDGVCFKIRNLSF